MGIRGGGEGPAHWRVFNSLGVFSWGASPPGGDYKTSVIGALEGWWVLVWLHLGPSRVSLVDGFPPPPPCVPPVEAGKAPPTQGRPAGMNWRLPPVGLCLWVASPCLDLVCVGSWVRAPLPGRGPQSTQLCGRAVRGSHHADELRKGLTRGVVCKPLWGGLEDTPPPGFGGQRGQSCSLNALMGV